MSSTQNITEHLKQWAQQSAGNQAVTATLLALLKGSVTIAEIASYGRLAQGFSGEAGTTNEDGDSQKKLDVIAHDILLNACKKAPVAVLGSEEANTAITLTPDAPLVVVMDPLDGSSNIETNAPIGTIFSIYAMPEGATAEDAVLQAGSKQLTAGYVIYGTQTALMLTVGEGTHSYILDVAAGDYQLVQENIEIPEIAREYAINASNQCYWEPAIQNYIADCTQADADKQQKFNMRWVASLVAEAHRILHRGGVFLYPRDSRKGYENGRLRLVYEANAMAFLMEQASGAASDGMQRILQIKPSSLHQRVPLVMGSKANVAQIANYHVHAEQNKHKPTAPLFAARGFYTSDEGKG